MLLFHKVQNQACEQTMSEVEKDFKKMIDHMTQTHDAMEVGFPLISQDNNFSKLSIIFTHLHLSQDVCFRHHIQIS